MEAARERDNTDASVTDETNRTELDIVMSLGRDLVPEQHPLCKNISYTTYETIDLHVLITR